MTTIDWNKESENKEYVVVPEGTYLVKVLSHEYCVSKQKQTPQIKWSYEIIDGPFKGKKLSDWHVLLETTLWKIAGFVFNCGVDLKGLPSMEIGSPVFKRVLDACLDRKILVAVNQETFNNKPSNKVTEYFSVEEGKVKPGVKQLEDVPEFIKESTVNESELPF